MANQVMVRPKHNPVTIRQNWIASHDTFHHLPKAEIEMNFMKPEVYLVPSEKATSSIYVSTLFWFFLDTLPRVNEMNRFQNRNKDTTTRISIVHILRFSNVDSRIRRHCIGCSLQEDRFIVRYVSCFCLRIMIWAEVAPLYARFCSQAIVDKRWSRRCWLSCNLSINLDFDAVIKFIICRPYKQR